MAQNIPHNHQLQDSSHFSCLCNKRAPVGIVGGGIAGLYTALLLKRQNISFHIFEGTERVGGRVLTHYFSPEKDQYFEAGAMRIPKTRAHDIIFDLVDYLNGINAVERPNADRHIQLIDYILNMKGNQIYVNGILKDGYNTSSQDISAQSLGWPVPEPLERFTADQLLQTAISPLLDPLRVALEDSMEKFETVFRTLALKWDRSSFRTYLEEVTQYPPSVIDFIETVQSQTNQFALSVPELIMQNLDFGVKDWKTIDRGMSRLPQAMLAAVGNENITFGARVTSIRLRTCHGINLVEVNASGYNGNIIAGFDKLVLAIPPAALKTIISRPLWSPNKEMAIRSIHFEPLYKMGMRFKYRFWERVENPSMGGQTATDLPIRWIVFPSNGIGASGNPEGVLLVYAWMSDAATWLPLTPLERRSLALANLKEVYKGRLGQNPNTGRDITVAELLIETFDAVWSASTATGDAI